MTKLYKIPPDLFAGKTVAVLGSGPSLTQECVDSVRHLPRVCARWSAKMAPDADIVIAIDGLPDDEFWSWAQANCTGKLLCGALTDALPDEVGYYWQRYENVTLSTVPCHIIEFRNNGMSAIHIAEQGGAAKILLLGFDPDKPLWFYDTAQSMHVPILYPGLAEGLNQLITKLRAKGIEVKHIKPAVKTIPLSDTSAPFLTDRESTPIDPELAGRKRKRSE